MKRLSAAAVLLLVVVAAGCAKRGGDPFAPDDMIQSRTRLPNEPTSPVDQPGAIPYDNPQAAPDDRQPPRPAPGNNAGRMPQSLVPRNDVPATQNGVAANGAAAPSTRPTTSNFENAGYQTIGGVVARVNNTPIYAEQVLAAIESKLADHARQHDEATFRKLAEKEIGDAVTKAIIAELQFAAAERYLSHEERQQAQDMATAWRARQVNMHGGSNEAAREYYRLKGADFEQLVSQQHRNFLRQLYDRKKIYPRVRVTAADMRRFYEQNQGTAFTIKDAAQFEVIKIDPKRVGSAEEARAKAEEIRSRAAGGEDFAKLTEFSHLPRMRAADGTLSWIQRGAVALDAVEAAVWKLNPGEGTPAVEARK